MIAIVFQFSYCRLNSIEILGLFFFYEICTELFYQFEVINLNNLIIKNSLSLCIFVRNWLYFLSFFGYNWSLVVLRLGF